MLEKPSQFCHQSSVFEAKSLDVALHIAGVERIR